MTSILQYIIIFFVAFINDYAIIVVNGFASGLCPRKSDESFIMGLELNVDDLASIINQYFNQTTINELVEINKTTNNSIIIDKLNKLVGINKTINSSIKIDKLNEISSKPLTAIKKHLTDKYLSKLYHIEFLQSSSLQFYGYVENNTNINDIIKINKIYTNSIKQTINFDVKISMIWFSAIAKYQNNYKILSKSAMLLFKNFIMDATFSISINHLQCICYNDDSTSWALKIIDSIKTLTIEDFNVDYQLKTDWDNYISMANNLATGAKDVAVATKNVAVGVASWSYSWLSSQFSQQSTDKATADTTPSPIPAASDNTKNTIFYDLIQPQIVATFNSIIYTVSRSKTLEELVQNASQSLVNEFTNKINEISKDIEFAKYCLVTEVRKYSSQHLSFFVTINENIKYSRFSRTNSAYGNDDKQSSSSQTTSSTDAAKNDLYQNRLKFQQELYSTLDKYFGDNEECRSPFSLLVNFGHLERLMVDNIGELLEYSGIENSCKPPYNFRKKSQEDEYKKYVSMTNRKVICIDEGEDDKKTIDSFIALDTESFRFNIELVHRSGSIHYLAPDLEFQGIVRARKIETISSSLLGLRDSILNTANAHTFDDAAIKLTTRSQLSSYLGKTCNDACIDIIALLPLLQWNLIQNMKIEWESNVVSAVDKIEKKFETMTSDMKSSFFTTLVEDGFNKIIDMPLSKWCLIMRVDMTFPKIGIIEFILTKNENHQKEKERYSNIWTHVHSEMKKIKLQPAKK